MKQKKDKPPKVRASKYETPLKINGTFDQVIKALVKEPKIDYTKSEKDKDKKV